MAVSDILKDIGEGVKTGAKAVGALAQPIAQRTAQVVSGEAPKIDEEQRQKQTDLEDAQINVKAQALESQLAMGQKYGTLTPAQQQQYVDQITGLYSHPRHAGVLMEKLRKAIHPNGAFASGPSAPLANATPEGGTAAADTRNANAKKAAKPLTGVKPFKSESDGKYYQPVETPDGKIENVEVPDYQPPPVKPAGGKSPPVTGDQLPSDAMGPDGKPIDPAERNAGKSYVEFHGAFYPVAPAKPVFKTVRGHSVLVNSSTGAILRDLGPVGTAKVTTHQSLQPGDDGQMHMVTLTSVSTPEGATIEVEPDQGQTPEPGTPKPGGAPKTPAKKVTPGSLLPKTGAKPAAKEPGVVPGLSTLAHHKLQSNQDRQVLESSKQIISAVDDLMPILEKRKGQGGIFDAASQRAKFAAYKAGLPTDPETTKLFENVALLSVVGAGIWSRLGRSRYTFEVIQQHLPQTTDTPELLYDKVKWLRDNVVPAAQDAIANPQPDNSGAPSGGGKTIVVSAEDMK